MRIRYILFVTSLLLTLVPPALSNPIDGGFAIVSVDFDGSAYYVSNSYTDRIFYDDNYIVGEGYFIDSVCYGSTCVLTLFSSDGDSIHLGAYGVQASDRPLATISSVDVCSSESIPSDWFPSLSEFVKPAECPIISFMGRNIPFCSARDIAAVCGSAFGLFLCVQLFI